MIISEVSISNLRATKFNKVKFFPGTNVLYGRNGIGKTTILEAIYLLSYGKSFKTSDVKNVIGTAEETTGAFLETSENHRLKIEIKNHRKKILLNNNAINKISDHIYFLPSIVSSPDETTLEGRQNSYKQKNINKGLCLVDKKYLQQLKKYNTTLKQRNVALKIGKDYDLWEEGLAKYSEKIWKERKKYVKKINQSMKEINFKNKTNLKTHVQLEIPDDTSYEKNIENIINSREKDLYTKKTNNGPHKDKIDYFINNNSVKTKASQGEKNIFFSIFKKAESDIIAKKTGKTPIVLLDDIFSKLDKKNTNLILAIYKNHPQTIITHTEKIETSICKQIKING